MGAPVGYTCPDIDKAIAIMEELRDANESLRSWGLEQEERADQAESELADAEARIESLEEKIENLEAQLAELEAQLAAVGSE